MKYLDTADAAELLSVSVDQIVSLIGAGLLKAVNIAARPGKPRYRIAQTELDAFIERRSTQPPVKVARRKKSKPQYVTQYV